MATFSQAAHESKVIATFVAAPGGVLDREVVACNLARVGARVVRFEWVTEGVALDAYFDGVDAALLRDRLHASLAELRVDVIVQAAATRRKSLLIADMDSTMIEQECIDELADAVGLRPHIAAITQRAMRGEIGFEAALAERVAMLNGLSVSVIDDIVATRLTFTPGAHTLVATMRAHGAHTALVSGGFTRFAEPVASALGFHETRANRLILEDGMLTGAIAPPILGSNAKAAALEEIRVELGLPQEATLAVGDGANDVEMVKAAGLGVAYRGKPVLAQAATARIEHADLTALLYAQGFRREEFVENG